MTTKLRRSYNILSRTLQCDTRTMASWHLCREHTCHFARRKWVLKADGSEEWRNGSTGRPHTRRIKCRSCHPPSAPTHIVHWLSRRLKGVGDHSHEFRKKTKRLHHGGMVWRANTGNECQEQTRYKTCKHQLTGYKLGSFESFLVTASYFI